MYNNCVYLFLEGDCILSYRDDLKAFANQRSKLIKTVILAVKITVVALALAIVATTVTVIVDVASASGSPNKGAFGGGGNSNSAPVISLVDGGDVIYVYAGENISWRKYVQAIDDEDGTLTPQIESNVNLDKEGIYSLTFSATDSSGKKTQKTVTVHVTKKEYSYSTLMAIIDQKIAELGIDKLPTTKEKVEAVYAYVNSSLNKGTQVQAQSNTPGVTNNRKNWRNDWIEEATRTLQIEKGDCYSYFSLSKAFFVRLGIEHEDIQQDNSKCTIDGINTHFWCMVNIGTSSNPSWYFYDATRLGGTFSDGTANGCLRTREEIDNYKPNKSGTGFYAFDDKDYPKTATKSLY